MIFAIAHSRRNARFQVYHLIHCHNREAKTITNNDVEFDTFLRRNRNHRSENVSICGKTFLSCLKTPKFSFQMYNRESLFDLTRIKYSFFLYHFFIII